MLKVLIPIDGSENVLQAVRHAVNRFMEDSRMEVHLLHVRVPFSSHVAQFSSKRNRESYHREMAGRALRPARELLNKHGVPHGCILSLAIGPRPSTACAAAACR